MASFPNRCQHIKVNGTQCGSPALRRNKLCYFHKLHHEERIALHLDRLKDARRGRAVSIDLPVLEDANAIQVSLMQIMRLIITGQIDSKTAGLLLYALQTASANLPRLRFEPFKNDVVLDLKTVHQTPLNQHIWEDSDFIADEDEDTDDEDSADQNNAEEDNDDEDSPADNFEAAIQTRLRSQAEANRITEEKIREGAAEFYRASHVAERINKSSHPSVTPAGRDVQPPAKITPSPAKRPPASVKMDEVRKQINGQIIEALPEIAAALSRRANGNNKAAEIKPRPA